MKRSKWLINNFLWTFYALIDKCELLFLVPLLSFLTFFLFLPICVSLCLLSSLLYPTNDMQRRSAISTTIECTVAARVAVAESVTITTIIITSRHRRCPSAAVVVAMDTTVIVRIDPTIECSPSGDYLSPRRSPVSLVFKRECPGILFRPFRLLPALIDSLRFKGNSWNVFPTILLLHIRSVANFLL